MYTLDLICERGHTFEGWFANRAAFEQQRDEGIVTCALCGGAKITQALSPVHTLKAAAPSRTALPAAPSMLAKIREYVDKNFDDVGAKFADEALKIHLGDTEQRAIRGTATPQEEQDLRDEGVAFMKLPDVQ
jgi:hypothetical protein